MADELTITATMQFDKGDSDYTVPTNGSPFSVTITGTNFLIHRQIVGTSEEALVLGDVDISANGAWLIMVNRDATNYVEIRPGTGVADMVEIPAGEVAMFKIPSSATAPFVIANTASCEVEYMLVEG